MAEPAIVTVHSLAGEILLQSVKVSSIHELAEKSAEILKVKKCRMISADGVLIAQSHDLTDLITAVAHDVDPLLQLVGFQDHEGELLDDLPRDELERKALERAASLAHIACWFGGPQHLAGCPRIPWGSQSLCVTRSTPVVPVGLRLLLSVKDDSITFPCMASTRAERNLTVEDLMSIRDAHDLVCKSSKPRLLSKHPGADSVHAVMRLVSFTSEEVHFELGHRVYKLGF